MPLSRNDFKTFNYEKFIEVIKIEDAISFSVYSDLVNISV
jgi:hypothetical protein